MVAGEAARAFLSTSGVSVWFKIPWRTIAKRAALTSGLTSSRDRRPPPEKSLVALRRSHSAWKGANMAVRFELAVSLGCSEKKRATALRRWRFTGAAGVATFRCACHGAATALG